MSIDNWPEKPARLRGFLCEGREKSVQASRNCPDPERQTSLLIRTILNIITPILPASALFMHTPPPSLRQTADLLYRDHHQWLRGWLSRKVGCTHQGADLAQDTFVRVLGANELGRLDEPRAFLMALAQRVLYSFWRRRNLENAWLEALAQQPENHAPSAEDYALVRDAIETSTACSAACRCAPARPS